MLEKEILARLDRIIELLENDISISKLKREYHKIHVSRESKVSLTMAERDEKIFQERKAGVAYKKLSKKYNMTEPSLRVLISNLNCTEKEEYKSMWQKHKEGQSLEEIAYKEHVSYRRLYQVFVAFKKRELLNK